MHLVIKRNQADMKGVFGGHKGVQFSLYCRLVLTPEEMQLVTRYRLEHHTLTRSQTHITSVQELLEGKTQTLESVEVLLHNERVIKEACDDFCTLIEVAKTFGGEEVVPLPLGSSSSMTS